MQTKVRNISKELEHSSKHIAECGSWSCRTQHNVRTHIQSPMYLLECKFHYIGIFLKKQTKADGRISTKHKLILDDTAMRIKYIHSSLTVSSTKRIHFIIHPIFSKKKDLGFL